jgi:hypothetical protein
MLKVGDKGSKRHEAGQQTEDKRKGIGGGESLQRRAAQHFQQEDF